MDERMCEPGEPLEAEGVAAIDEEADEETGPDLDVGPGDPFALEVSAYAARVAATKQFGEQVDRLDFFRAVGLDDPPADLDPEHYRVALDALRHKRVAALKRLKDTLASAHDLVVVRNASDRILYPRQVEAYAEQCYHEKEQAAARRLNLLLAVVRRYRARKLVDDMADAARSGLEALRAARNAFCGRNQKRH